MASFDGGDLESMRDWLAGSKEYITKVSIVVRWSTKIPGTTYDTTTGLSPIADPEADLNILETGQESEEQEIEDIFDVRLKRSGLSHDLKFRASSLNFTWPNYAQFKQGKSERAIRFYLKVSLIDSWGEELNLLKTDWYKIKDTEEIYSTSKSSGADVRIESIPWIYEYNEPTMEGNDARAWFQCNQYGLGVFGIIGGYDPEWFSATEGSTGSRARYLGYLLEDGVSIVAIGVPATGEGYSSGSTTLYAFLSNGMKISTGIRSKKTVKSWSIIEDMVIITFEDDTTANFSCNKPSLDDASGVYYTYHLDGGKWDRNGQNTFSSGYTNTPMSYRVSWNGISRVQKILHDMKVGDLPDSPCSYTGPFVFYNAMVSRPLFSDYELSKAVNAVLNMGPMKLVSSCEETALSYLSWWGLKEGSAIRPKSYIKDERVLDTPLVEFYELGYRIENDELDYISTSSYPVNDFDSIENSNEKVVFDEKYKYEVLRYLVSIPTYSYRSVRNQVGNDGTVTQVEVPPTLVDWCWAGCLVKMAYSVGTEVVYARGLIEGQLNFSDVGDFSSLETSQLSLAGVMPIIDGIGISSEQFYGNMNWMNERDFKFYVPQDWVMGIITRSTYVQRRVTTMDIEIIDLGYPSNPVSIVIPQDNPRNFKATVLNGSANVSMSYNSDTKILRCTAYTRSPNLLVVFKVDYDYDATIPGLGQALFTGAYLSAISKTEVVGTEGNTIQVDTHGAMDVELIDSNDFVSGESIGRSLRRGNLLQKYSEKTEGIKFNAEWRPWIGIYSKIRVKTMNSFGEDSWVAAMVTSIDSNADTMSATYEGIVLYEE